MIRRPNHYTPPRHTTQATGLKVIFRSTWKNGSSQNNVFQLRFGLVATALGISTFLCCRQSKILEQSASTSATARSKAAFTPAQHVARQQVARNKLFVARNMLLEATCCGQQANCCPQQVARPRNLLQRNMLRWCKRGIRVG